MIEDAFKALVRKLGYSPDLDGQPRIQQIAHRYRIHGDGWEGLATLEDGVVHVYLRRVHYRPVNEHYYVCDGVVLDREKLLTA